MCLKEGFNSILPPRVLVLLDSFVAVDAGPVVAVVVAVLAFVVAEVLVVETEPIWFEKKTTQILLLLILSIHFT